MMICTLCKGCLEVSGQEPYRYICSKCGQNFILRMELLPVEPLRPRELPETVNVEFSPRTK